MKSLQGQLLVASPHLLDTNFSRTVVLMVQHQPQGALGLVLNRPGPWRVHELWEKVGKGACPSTAPVGLGGPVEGPLMAVHQQPLFADAEVYPGLYFATRTDFLEKIVARTDGVFRLFVGFAGWGAGQLETELTAGGWLTAPAENRLIFDTDTADIWKVVIEGIGSELMQSSLRIKNRPPDPTVN